MLYKNPGVESHMEQMGCSSEILNLTPKGDYLGVAQAFCDPQRRPMWVWLKQILTSKRGHLKTHIFQTRDTF